MNLDCISDQKKAAAAPYRRLDVASVRILPLAIEHFAVQVDVIVVDGIIEGDCDHLRHVFRRQVAGDRRPILRAEAVR